MLKRTKNAISSTKGESYVFVCVIVLFISALVSVAIMYMGLMAQVQIQKRDVKIKLDNCITEYAVEAFDSIKQGESLESVIDLKLGLNEADSVAFVPSVIGKPYPIIKDFLIDNSLNMGKAYFDSTVSTMQDSLAAFAYRQELVLPEGDSVARYGTAVSVYFTLDKSLIPVEEPDGAEEEER